MRILADADEESEVVRDTHRVAMLPVSIPNYALEFASREQSKRIGYHISLSAC